MTSVLLGFLGVFLVLAALCAGEAGGKVVMALAVLSWVAAGYLEGKDRRPSAYYDETDDLGGTF